MDSRVTSVKELLQYFIPSALQAFYSFVAAVLIALYWCRSQLSERLLLAGSEESIQTFQELIKGFVDYWTNNEVIGSLSVGFIWAIVGVFILAAVYETINIFIALRNDKLIATQFTHAEENKKILLHDLTVKTILVAGLVVFLLLVFIVLFPFWHSLVSQPADHFFTIGSTMKEIIGMLGLAATICLGWRWAVILFSKLG